MLFESVNMDEAAYFRALADFLDAGRSQGFTSALNDLLDLCPLHERAMLFSAMQGIVLADSGSSERPYNRSARF